MLLNILLRIMVGNQRQYGVVRELNSTASRLSNENEKSRIVECWNRTMKRHTFMYFTIHTIHNTRRYVAVLNAMVTQYNITQHSLIEIITVMASLPEKEHIV